MLSNILVAFIIALVVVSAAIGIYYAITGKPPGAKVIEQDIPIPSDRLEDNQAKLMFFYVTWCPHCHSAQQPWRSFKEMLKNSKYTYGGKEIVCEDINAESDKGKASLYKIQAYPTIKLETSDKLFEMQGKPSIESFRQFLVNALGPEKVG